MSGLTYTINDAELQKLVGEMVQRIERRQPVMETIGDLAAESIQKNFAVGGRPGKWKALKYRSGSPLRDSGVLMNSIAAGPATASVVQVGTGEKYAAIHNFGGSTGPRVIRPKKGKALFWPGAAHPVKEVHHPGSVIPQREFMLLQKEDIELFKKMLAEWVTEGRT